MANIRIKTDMLDIKLYDIKPDEVKGAWKWVTDIVETFYGKSTETAKKNKLPDEQKDEPPREWFDSSDIKNMARSVISQMYIKMLKTHCLLDVDQYDVCTEGAEPFERICQKLIEENTVYTPIESARLTGKICSTFYLEQSEK